MGTAEGEVAGDLGPSVVPELAPSGIDGVSAGDAASASATPQAPEVVQDAAATAALEAAGACQAMQTLTSGRKRELHDGALQAHICVVATQGDIVELMAAFRQADGFRTVTSWSFAYRILSDDGSQNLVEGTEDGLDEGVGERILGVLRRFGLHGLLLVISRWQDYGATDGLELFGTQLYSMVVERCKDLIANLKQAVGMTDAEQKMQRVIEKPPPGPKEFNFGFLPPLPEPKVATKFGPNHFMAETSLNRPVSLPHLFGAGNVQLWMENDRCLRQLTESELWSLRSMRQPDSRIERLLQAVAVLRGQRSQRWGVEKAGSAAARWGLCREVLRSATFRTELVLFDASNVSPEAARTALGLLDGLEVEEVRRVNLGAAGLYEWVHGIARWRLEGGGSTGAGPAGEVSVEALQPREAEFSAAMPYSQKASPARLRPSKLKPTMAGGSMYRQKTMPYGTSFSR
mmetsp:Transcript_5911/g.10034  ORF Transcript_5911/g.10034 Transcript_5911/m.10034 type:complete len:460 (-) Transcript_5911:66-1445(-)